VILQTRVTLIADPFLVDHGSSFLTNIVLPRFLFSGGGDAAKKVIHLPL
jgi:hypothetical protein